jgi:hypothetical protein
MNSEFLIKSRIYFKREGILLILYPFNPEIIVPLLK